MFSMCQSDTAVKIQQDLDVVRIDENFNANYQRRLAQMRRTYPMALHAKKVLSVYDKKIALIDKKRKQKRFGRKAHKELKGDFSFNIRDLYVSEGELLIRLIHRETGLTVAEILEKYRSKSKSNMYSLMASMWGHDIDTKYDPEGEDWITELIIQDIENGHTSFDLELKSMEKGDYKKAMKDYKENRKKNKKAIRTSKKKQKRHS